MPQIEFIFFFCPIDMSLFKEKFISWPSWKLSLKDESSISHSILLRSWNESESNRLFGVFSELRDNYNTSIYEWFAVFMEGRNQNFVIVYVD